MPIHSVSTGKGGETDFLARHRTFGKVHLIQFCWEMADRKTFTRELRGLKIAMKELSLDAATIITWDDEAELDGNISVTPAWKWLLGAR